MNKPNRSLWEQNNRHRAFWGDPLLPEPEEGFAADLQSALCDEVENWFREATSSQIHRRRTPKIPNGVAIARIACLVSEYCELLDRPSDPVADEKSAVAFRKAHTLQRAVAHLEGALHDVLGLLNELNPNDPAITRLIDIHNAIRLAEPYIGPPPAQGPRPKSWHVIARKLEEKVREALISAGHLSVSTKSDGPLVRVVGSALRLVYGDPPSHEAISSALQRRRQKGGAKI